MNAMESNTFLSLGTNLGDKRKNLISAIEAIGKLDQTSVIAHSSIYSTKAWGNADQPDFYNQVIEVNSYLSPQFMMEAILGIEEKLGRIRKEKWGPRIIDIDILIFGEKIIDSSNLIVPHPHLENRKFILIPFAEIAPEIIHPILKTSIAQLLSICIDELEVEKVPNP